MKVAKVFNTSKEAEQSFHCSIGKLGQACMVNYRDLLVYVAGVEYYYISCTAVHRLRGMKLDRAYISEKVPEHLAMEVKAQIKRI